MSTLGTISYMTEEDFYAGIAAAVKAGLTFEARVFAENQGKGCWTWEIEFTGGY